MGRHKKRNEINFTFVGTCIVNIFKHNQQDAKFNDGIYYYKCIYNNK